MIEANVVAITFYKPSLEFWSHLKNGVEVTLEREPTNPRDKNAIKVLHNGTHFGYLEKEKALLLSPMMDVGRKPQATITRVFGTPTDRPHIELSILLL